jgi:hypothetical protein
MAKEYGVTIYFDTEAQVIAFRTKAALRSTSMSDLGKGVLVKTLDLDTPLIFDSVSLIEDKIPQQSSESA